jgi:hypothetical protein
MSLYSGLDNGQRIGSINIKDFGFKGLKSIRGDVLIVRSAPIRLIEHIRDGIKCDGMTLLCQRSFDKSLGFSRVIRELPDRMLQFRDIFSLIKIVRKYDYIVIPTSDRNGSGMMNFVLLTLLAGKSASIITAGGRQIEITKNIPKNIKDMLLNNIYTRLRLYIPHLRALFRHILPSLIHL